MLLFSALSTGVTASVKVVVTADRLGCRTFLYRRPRDLVLDTLLGPAEDFEAPRTTR